MEDAGGDGFNSSCLEKIRQNCVSFSKEYSVHGIVGALLLAVVVPLIFSSINAHKTKNRKRAVPVDAGGEPGLTMRNSRFSSLIQYPWDGATTVAALFEQVCEKHSKDRFLGTRKLISREAVESGNGRKFEKLHLGEYQWQTYGLAFERSCSFASGLIKTGHERDSHVAIFSDTRAEWLIAAQGCFRQNIIVVTIYASLGEDALVHSLNETQVSTLICDFKQLKKLPAVSSRLQSIKRVIYFEDEAVDAADAGIVDCLKHWTILSFAEVESLGRTNPADPVGFYPITNFDDNKQILYLICHLAISDFSWI